MPATSTSLTCSERLVRSIVGGALSDLWATPPFYALLFLLWVGSYPNPLQSRARMTPSTAFQNPGFGNLVPFSGYQWVPGSKSAGALKRRNPRLCGARVPCSFTIFDPSPTALRCCLSAKQATRGPAFFFIPGSRVAAGQSPMSNRPHCGNLTSLFQICDRTAMDFSAPVHGWP